MAAERTERRVEEIIVSQVSLIQIINNTLCRFCWRY
jgi:hypothetical protein